MKLFTILRNIITRAKNYTDNTFGQMADYIVEEGISGNWTYRKWASGIAECWGRFTSPTITYTGWGNYFYSSGSTVMQANYPSGLFIEAPAETAQIINSTNGSAMLVFSGNNSKTQTTGYAFGRPTTINAPVYIIGIHAKGLWKTFTQVGGGNT